MKHAKTSKHSKVGRVIGCIVSSLIIITAIVYLSACKTENVELSRTSKSDVTQYCESAPVQLSSTIDSAPLSTVSAALEDVELESSDVEDAEDDESALNFDEDSSDTICFEDVDLLAKLIYLEAGTCPEDCQWLVGSTAVNLAEDRGGLEAVAYDYNTFNVAYQIDSCSPSETSYAVAFRILSGDRDHQVYAFRTGMYHEWATPYISIDNVYFSIC